MESLFKDIRYGVRGLLKRKGFAAIAVLTLALGIGANTAIFTLVNAVMLKSLPVQKPEELVLFSDTTSEGTSILDAPRSGKWDRFSYASYEYFRKHNQSFQEIAATSKRDQPPQRATNGFAGRCSCACVWTSGCRYLFLGSWRARDAWPSANA